MAAINITPALAAILRAVRDGHVSESRDGALHRWVRNGHRTVPLAQTSALEAAEFIRLAGGRPAWQAGPYVKPFELTEAGRVWLAEYDTTTKE